MITRTQTTPGTWIFCLLMCGGLVGCGTTDSTGFPGPAAGGSGGGGATGSGGATGGSGGVNCNCAASGDFPVCGVDGTTYDASCGMECVPVAIACSGECPCDPSGTAGSGAAGVCDGFPAHCFPLCQGGQCECYCDSAGGTGGQATGGAAGSGGAPAGGGTGGVDCNCVLGAYIPVCGVDGVTYDATCGIECVPVEVDCTGECPCATGTCTEDCASQGLLCCDGRCVNADNDPLNCGGCGAPCSAPTAHCNMGNCEAPYCDPATSCVVGDECCGTECCTGGQLCCLIMAGPWFTQCTDPVEGTCPVGNPMAVCADPDTPVATPDGEVRIEDLRVGDLVYSIEHEGIVAVPVARVHQTPVTGHQVIRVTLATGRTLDMSAMHPTADGRDFGTLAAGQMLDGVRIRHVERVPYEHAFTHDILPDSETGTYFAAGVAIGSTLTLTAR